MPTLHAWFWGLLLTVGLGAVSVGGALLVRRWVTPEVLERHNEVAGFIYSIVGVLYAVLLGFTAIIVWEQYERAHTRVEQEANQVADLYRDAQAFPPDVRKQLEKQLRAYARIVVEKEWPAMARGESSPEAWEVINDLWRIYHNFRPRDAHESAWYAESIQQLNDLGDHRRLRLLSNRAGVPRVMWAALLGAGAITIAFSFLFGTRNAWAQIVMIAGLAVTIGLVLLSVVALEHPFAGVARVGPEPFDQLTEIFDRWSQPQTGQGR